MSMPPIKVSMTCLHFCPFMSWRPQPSTCVLPMHVLRRCKKSAKGHFPPHVQPQVIQTVIYSTKVQTTVMSFQSPILLCFYQQPSTNIKTASTVKLLTNSIQPTTHEGYTEENQQTKGLVQGTMLAFLSCCISLWMFASRGRDMVWLNIFWMYWVLGGCADTKSISLKK